MKLDVSARRKKPKINLRSQIFSLSNAKSYLGRLMDQAGRGEPVYFVSGQRRFLLPEVPEIEPLPVRPPGYFKDTYSPAEIEQANRLAKASVIRAPKDLE